MSTKFKSSWRVAGSLLVIVALTGCAGLATSPPAAIQQQIEAARTPADHAALATYYDKEAAAARNKAEEHRKMGKGYAAWPAGGRGGGSWTVHCNSAAASYEDIARRFDSMAAEHRQLAK